MPLLIPSAPDLASSHPCFTIACIIEHSIKGIFVYRSDTNMLLSDVDCTTSLISFISNLLILPFWSHDNIMAWTHCINSPLCIVYTPVTCGFPKQRAVMPHLWWFPSCSPGQMLKQRVEWPLNPDAFNTHIKSSWLIVAWWCHMAT